MLANTFTPPKLDSLIQPGSTRLIPIPHVNGGSFQSLSLGEGPGPIRSHARQAARERPSPVAYDGGFSVSILHTAAAGGCKKIVIFKERFLSHCKSNFLWTHLKY